MALGDVIAGILVGGIIVGLTAKYWLPTAHAVLPWLFSPANAKPTPPPPPITTFPSGVPGVY